MLKIEFRAMGCQMTALVDRETSPAARLLQQVPAWFEEWEQALSRFRQDSELNRLNQQAGQPFQTSPVLFEAVSLALEAARWSGGMVIPTLRTELEKAGYDRSFELLNTNHSGTTQKSTKPAWNGSQIDAWREIQLDETRSVITLPPGARLDLGGTAKSWAAQQAVKRLSAAGPALVDAAGDLAASGPMSDGSPWPVDIADPLEMQENLALLALSGGGAATSGIHRRRWRQNGHWQHHIIDPRTGLPVQTDLYSVTVTAPDVTRAEVAAKVALLLGSQAGLEWLESQPELAGLMALQDGSLIYSQRMLAQLWSEYVR